MLCLNHSSIVDMEFAAQKETYTGMQSRWHLSLWGSAAQTLTRTTAPPKPRTCNDLMMRTSGYATPVIRHVTRTPVMLRHKRKEFAVMDVSVDVGVDRLNAKIETPVSWVTGVHPLFFSGVDSFSLPFIRVLFSVPSVLLATKTCITRRSVIPSICVHHLIKWPSFSTSHEKKKQSLLQILIHSVVSHGQNVSKSTLSTKDSFVHYMHKRCRLLSASCDEWTYSLSHEQMVWPHEQLFDPCLEMRRSRMFFWDHAIDRLMISRSFFPWLEILFSLRRTCKTSS